MISIIIREVFPFAEVRSLGIAHGGTKERYKITIPGEELFLDFQSNLLWYQRDKSRCLAQQLAKKFNMAIKKEEVA